MSRLAASKARRHGFRIKDNPTPVRVASTFLVRESAETWKWLRARRKFVVGGGGLRDAVLADLIEQGFVADLQHRGGLFSIPVRFLKSPRNRFRLRFILGGPRQ